MTVDIIILSHAKTEALKQLTQQTINSCLASETEIQFHILVMEQNTSVVYQNASTYHITDGFNYNRFLNIGIELTNAEYVCLCNNDLIFSKHWARELIGAMKWWNILSACPACPVATRKGKDPVQFGYNNSQEMSGWCIMTDRKLYETIGNIDEDFPFWFADNAYAEQLKTHEVKHALVRSSIVRHLGSSTLNTLDKVTHDEITIGYAHKFFQKYPNNESAVYFSKFL